MDAVLASAVLRLCRYYVPLWKHGLELSAMGPRGGHGCGRASPATPSAAILAGQRRPKGTIHRNTALPVPRSSRPAIAGHAVEVHACGNAKVHNVWVQSREQAAGHVAETRALVLD